MTVATRAAVVEYGLTQVYSAHDPLVDVVFVHGLNGHPYSTWATAQPEVFWLADLLPSALEEQRPRILTYGYDASVTAFTDGTSKDRIHNHAEHLASRLVANRSLNKAQERPIIFVCHSLGGLVVKRCLIYCQSIRHHQHTARLRSVYVSTYGVLFLGTPHNGSDLAKWGSLLQKLCSAVLPKKFLDTSPQLVQALRTNNETLQNINRLFIEIIGRFHIYFFHESKPMDLKGTRDFVVDEDSAAPVIEGVERMGIEKDHSHMCKFTSENDPGYDVVAEAIQRYATDSPQLIRSRWEEEKSLGEFERHVAARELLGDSIYQISGGTPGSATPSLGRANQLNPSFSMSAPRPMPPISASHSTPYEVEEVEEEDYVPAPSKVSGKRRNLLTLTHECCFLGDSTSSIKMIEAPPEPSSSQLLIAPLGFRPNTIFVGFDMELDRLHQKLNNQKRLAIGTCAVLIWGPPGCGKTHLAREYVWRHRSEYPSGIFWVDCRSPETRSRSFWDIGQALALHGIENSTNPDVDAVRKWFEGRDGWLLVFDRVVTDNDSEIQELVPFIPDRAGNRVIFTSVDRTLAKRQRLLNPAAVKVYPLSQEEACELLYKSLGTKRPENELQAKKAVQLAKYYEGLPLAIHAAAHALIARGRALEKWSPGASDYRLAEPFIEIMAALRDRSHPEAINLITLLSFFSHTVPVALIRFGRIALAEAGVELRSRSDGAGSMRVELDNTIAMLIRYGLIERTLLSYSVSSTNDSSSLEVSQQQEGPAPDQREALAGLPEDDSSGLQSMIECQPDGRIDQTSTNSVTYSIDILRLHSVVSAVLRDDLKHQNKAPDQRRDYWGWLSLATKLFCESYRVANEKILSGSDLGLVRDYREYETQAASLWLHFPKSADDAPVVLRRARHQLHDLIRSVRHEIQTRSPSQSTHSVHHSVHVSVFERSNSTSDEDGPDTSSDLTRVSTWTLEHGDLPTESPTEMKRSDDRQGSEDSWSDKWTEYDLEESRLTMPSGKRADTRRSSRSEVTEVPQEPNNRVSRRPSLIQDIPPSDNRLERLPSVLHVIFQGRRPSDPRKSKDLGEWKPMPVPPRLSKADVNAVRSRASSASSFNKDRSSSPLRAASEAESALAAVHRSSPPPSRGGRIRSPARPQSLDRSGFREVRVPVANQSPTVLSQSLPVADAALGPHRHSRNPSSSPRLVQTVLASQAMAHRGAEIPVLPLEENIAIERRIPALSPRAQLSRREEASPHMVPSSLPSGYTSQPMSRDPSRESNVSLATAPPAVPGSASLGTSPQVREPYIYSRPGLASIDVVAANNPRIELGRMGEWANVSPMTPADPLEDGLRSDAWHEGVAQSVQFGQMSPVEIEHARARATAAREDIALDGNGGQ